MTVSSSTRHMLSGVASDGVFQRVTAPASLTRLPFCSTSPSVRSPSSEASAMIEPPVRRSSGSAAERSASPAAIEFMASVRPRGATRLMSSLRSSSASRAPSRALTRKRIASGRMSGGLRSAIYNLRRM